MGVAPRPVLKKSVLHVVRRTARREYRLRPSYELNQLVGYLLAYCTKKYAIEIHSLIVMPTHYHVGIADPHGNESRFRQCFNSHLARALKVEQGFEHQALFERKQGGVMRALEPESAMDDVVYICCNPVRAGIVKRGKDYPGLRIGPEDWGKELVFKRPNFFFSDFETFEEKLTLVPKPPPGWRTMPLEEAREKALRLIAEREKQIHKEFKATGRKFSKKRLKKALTDSPKTPSGLFAPNPKFKSRDSEAARAFVEFLSTFRARYRAALEDLKDFGEAAFPVGTDLYARRGLVEFEVDECDHWFRFYLPPPGKVF